MHEIEPYYNWKHIYSAEEDLLSPFYERQYSEFEYTQTVYNYFIHPQWDEFGSKTLYLKILMVDYELSYCIIELIGEWNDAIENDIMTLKREVADQLMKVGIYHFILIAENVLNFHSGDKDYYEEWLEEVMDKNGWLVMVNMNETAKYDFEKRKLHYIINLIEFENWRIYRPHHLYAKILDILAFQITAE